MELVEEHFIYFTFAGRQHKHKIMIYSLLPGKFYSFEWLHTHCVRISFHAFLFIFWSSNFDLKFATKLITFGKMHWNGFVWCFVHRLKMPQNIKRNHSLLIFVDSHHSPLFWSNFVCETYAIWRSIMSEYLISSYRGSSFPNGKIAWCWCVNATRKRSFKNWCVCVNTRLKPNKWKTNIISHNKFSTVELFYKCFFVCLRQSLVWSFCLPHSHSKLKLYNIFCSFYRNAFAIKIVYFHLIFFLTFSETIFFFFFICFLIILWR